MYLRTFKKTLEHQRTSKLGKVHTYKRIRTFNLFRCDNCDKEFVREHSKMDPKRISNRFFHVCSDCNAKKFAQRMGVSKRKIWDMPVSSDMSISKI